MVTSNEIIHDLVEQVAVEARGSEFVDAKSGVSARLTISAYEQVVAGAERRALINGESNTYVRLGDFISAVPAITGKVELVYEGEQEGAGIVAEKLMGKAVRTLFLNYFPDPDKSKKLKNRPSPYKTVQEWFGNGHTLDLLHDADTAAYRKALDEVPGLRDIVKELHPNETPEHTYFLMEFLLHGLAEYSLISRNRLSGGAQFKDLLASMFTMPSFDDEDEDEDEDEKPRRRR